MPRYVTLINWTEQGISGFKDTVDRYETAGSSSKSSVFSS